MLYCLFVTPECNLKCQYCGGSIHGMSQEIQYSLDELTVFLQRDPEAVVAFYGGEPLLRVDRIKEMLQTLPAKHFVINTNGYNFHALGENIHSFDTILLSIDGRKEVTDWYRGQGCYRQVMKALQFLKDNSFLGEIIARMAVSKQSDIFQDVSHLLTLFPFVHWQLDVIWSPLWELEEFNYWVETSYKPGLLQLLDEWVDHIKKGTIQGIVPFLGIMSRLLHGGEGLPCQAGDQAMAITTDGKLLGCPIAPDFEWNEMGDFNQYTSITIGEPCTSCEVYTVCGGRCLFAYKEQLWGKKGFEAVCNITKFLIQELDKRKQICEPIKDQFRYPPFNNTTEIIP